MLWEYSQIFLLIAVIFTIMAFLNNTPKYGRLFFLFFGGLMWLCLAYSLIDLDLWYGGSINPVHYNYDATWDARVILYGVGGIGLVMVLIGVIQVFSLLEPPEGIGEVYHV